MEPNDKGPTVRLVANAKQGRAESKIVALRPPDVRLAWFDIPAVNNTLAPPTVRLAYTETGKDPAERITTAIGKPSADPEGVLLLQDAPALLVSYVYVRPFLANRKDYLFRNWVMDSGAFSAHNTGAKIDLNQYVDFCLHMLEWDPQLTEVFALDEIPASTSAADITKAIDQSLKNTEEMWRQGVPAIPCFHYGEPESVLCDMAKEYPKIALGGMVKKGGGSMGQEDKFGWLEQCFARVWPKKIHGFGVSAERMVWGLPFHSVDATNWEIGPCAYGNWQKYGSMSVRGSNQDLRSQVKHFLQLEAKARVKWKREMALLDELDADPAASWNVKAQQAAKAREERAARPQPAASATEPAPASEPATKKKPRAAKAKAKPAPTPPPATTPATPGTGKLPQEWEDYWAKRF